MSLLQNQKTIQEIVEISRHENIDIAVDLKGFTKDNRFKNLDMRHY